MSNNKTQVKTMTTDETALVSQLSLQDQESKHRLQETKTIRFVKKYCKQTYSESFQHF